MIYICGEDDVTRWIAERLARHCATAIGLGDVDVEVISPRQSGARSLEPRNLRRMLNLAREHPVIAVFDSDNECVRDLLRRHMPDGPTAFAAVRFACDEGEAWLLCDRAGFARHLGVPLSLLPRCDDRPELCDAIPYKTSLYVLREIAPYARRAPVRDALRQHAPNKKPPTYNVVWRDFIAHRWNIDAACAYSASLRRAVRRIADVLEGYAGRRGEGGGFRAAARPGRCPGPARNLRFLDLPPSLRRDGEG